MFSFKRLHTNRSFLFILRGLCFIVQAEKSIRFFMYST